MADAARAKVAADAQRRTQRLLSWVEPLRRKDCRIRQECTVLRSGHGLLFDLTPEDAMTPSVPLDALLAECDSEPIQFPGAVQPHGALLAVDVNTWGVTHASANLGAFLDRDAATALGQPLAALFGDEVTALLGAAAQARRANPAATGLDAGLAGGRVRLLPFVSTRGAICIDLLHEPPPDPAEPALIQAQRVIQSLRLSRTSTGLSGIAVNDVRRITGFDRVMVYRFDEDGSGDVVAEDHAPGVVSFLGLKYPASDIPQQARRLYMVQRIRVIPDVNAEPVSLLAVPGSLATDLDLSASWVRAVSPIHLQYLRHMGVTATAVVSLIVAGRLWGMLVCHHNAPRQVSADQRALLDLVGQVMSVMLGSLTESEQSASRTQRQRALSGIAAAVVKPQDSIDDAFAAAASDLVNLVPAHGAVVTVGGRVIAVGHTPGPDAFRTIVTALAALATDDLSASASLRKTVADDCAALDGFAGALLLPLPSCAGGSIVWFRRELNLTVNWAGNPAKRAPDPATGRLEPRQSFAIWHEEVRGRSAPWTQADFSAARELRRIVDEALVHRNEAELLLRLRDHDPLTGLLNRTAAEGRLKTMASMPVQAAATLVIVNIDRFRKVNDLLGHRAGDALLVQVAHRLQVIAQPGDFVARLGPDEFGLLSTKPGDEGLAGRVFSAFAQPFEIARHVLQMYVSVGVADNSAAGSAVFELLRSAETAMRQSKSAGGNRISHFVQNLHDEAARQLVIEQSLDEALRAHRDQFQLAFQPIVNAASGALRSWEVLLRWHHPTLGHVAPGVFIPIAESCGLIVGVGQMVLDEAFRHLVEVPPSAEPGEEDVYVAVNVSPLQLTRPGFAADLATMLQERAVTPSRLCVEVTEGVFTDKDALAAIEQIRRLGVLVAVDDFGIGYSSLSTLQRLPADVVKLDRSFLPDQGTARPSDRSFLGAVVSLAHTVGLKVVIEGVETQVQLDAVVAAGVDAIQGYFLARPMSSEVAMAMSCQRNDERSWQPKLEAARAFVSGTELAGWRGRGQP
jgi:diguanylate cyclase (GGDEF)-like protein